MTHQSPPPNREKKHKVGYAEIKMIRELIPTLRKLQQDFRGIASLYPQYRGKEYAEVFYEQGNMEYLEAIAFINYLELITKL